MNRGSWIDLLLAVSAAVVIAVSPMTTTRLIPCLAMGAVVGIGVWIYRRRFAAAGEAPTAEAEVAPTPSTVAVPGSCWVLLALFAVIATPTAQFMLGQWTFTVWLNTHCVFVPPLVAYLAVGVLRQDRIEAAESSALGFLFFVPGTLLAFIDVGMRTGFLASIGLVLCLPGLSLLLLGRRRTWALRLPLLAAFFMIPIPYAVSAMLFLREMATAGSAWALRMLGYAAFADGTMLMFPWGSFHVSAACSGISALYSSVAIASVLAFLATTQTRRALVLLSAIPLALATNVLRVLVLAYLMRFGGEASLHSPMHPASGVATFAIVLVSLRLLAGSGDVRRAFA